MQRILITGGSGQVGRALVLSKPADYEVYAPTSAQLDITDAESVSRAFARFRPDLVVNAAAHTAVDKAESERELAFAVNADGAGNVARACRADSVPLIHLSTDYVFDGSSTSPYTEDDRPNPFNVYGESKLAGERQIEGARIPHLILRVSWVFSALGSNFVRTMLKLAPNDTLRVVNDQRGTPCAAADIAATLWRCAANPEAFAGVLHFASTPPTTWYGLANAIFEIGLELGLIQRAPRVEPISTDQYPTPARRPANSLLDSSRLQSLVGFEPPDWRDSLRSVLATIVSDERSDGR